MFTNLFKTSSMLDRAIVVSIVAMLAFTRAALTASVESPLALAQVSGNVAEQA